MRKNKKWKTLNMWQKEALTGYFFSLPFIIGLLFFLVVPMFVSLYYSFCDFNILSDARWTGLKNYAAIFRDDDFYDSLFLTLKFAVFSVPLRLLAALAVAILLFRSTRMTPIYRAVFYFPSIIGSSVAIAILWKRLFAADGLINSLFGTDIGWIGNPKTAMWVIIILSVWQFGSSMLLFLAAMKQIPESLYDAAYVDGAGGFRAFFTITMPLLTPTIFFNLVMQSINAFLIFAQAQLITNGGPLKATRFYVLYMYQTSFEFSKAGYGAALGWVIVLVIMLYTLFLFRTKKYWVYEE